MGCAHWGGAGAGLEHQGGVRGAQFSRDESHILTWSIDKTARLWDAHTGKQLGASLEHQGAVLGAQFSRDESRILTWSEDKTARLWDSGTGKVLGRTLEHRAWFSARSSAGTSAASLPGVMTTRRVCGMRRRASNSAPRWSTRARFRGAQFSRDERRILTWSSDTTVRLWAAVTGQAGGLALAQQGTVVGARLSRDESRILTWSTDKTARLWDARTGKALGAALEHKGGVRGAQFSTDESRILTWSEDNTSRLWDARTGEALGAGLEHQGGVRGARLQPGTRATSSLGVSTKRRGFGMRTRAGNWARRWSTKARFLARRSSRDESRILTWSEDKNGSVVGFGHGQGSGQDAGASGRGSRRAVQPGRAPHPYLE